jgi:hypothetical protein
MHSLSVHATSPCKPLRRADGEHSDSPENRALWRKHAPEALHLLDAVKKDKAKEVQQPMVRARCTHACLLQHWYARSV